jgi:hypothetical protein
MPGFIHTIGRSYRDSSGRQIQSSEPTSGNTESNFDGTVAGTTTNHEVDYLLTAAALQSCCIFTDQAITIKTNSSSMPQETITLAAGQNLVWDLAFDGAGKIPFAGNVTKLFITNSGSVAANISIRALETL